MLDMKQEISTEIKQELVKQALAARKFCVCAVFEIPRRRGGSGKEWSDLYRLQH